MRPVSTRALLLLKNLLRATSAFGDWHVGRVRVTYRSDLGDWCLNGWSRLVVRDAEMDEVLARELVTLVELPWLGTGTMESQYTAKVEDEGLALLSVELLKRKKR